MARHKHPDTSEPHLPGEAEIARIYAAGGQDEPPVALDQKILAAAQQSVQPPRRRTHFGARWAVPASIAAVILLSFGVLLQMQEPGLLGPTDIATAPASAPAAPAQESPALVARNAPERTPAKRLLKSSAAAPPAMAEIADGALPQPATDTLGEAKEKSLARTQDATSALASAPATVEKRAEPSKTATMTGEVQARNRFKQEVDNMKPQADVSTVRASGQAGAYEFNVTLRSPDSGCQQYADWWEVVSEDGKLLYRRVLLHSHVQEQPFTRSGGPVPIQPTTQVWVRAHMNNGGYGGTALKGSVQTGFVPTATPVNFAAHLATQAPLPTGCDF